MNNTKNEGVNLFRFQPYYHSNNEKLRANEIKHNEIWFSSPENLNDLVDIKRDFDSMFSLNDNDLQKFLKIAEILYSNNNFPQIGLINKDFINNIKECLNQNHDLNFLNQLFKNRLFELGIACFTKDWNNPPMWAHYASNWKGFVIKYNVRQMDLAEKNENFFLQFGINYNSYLSPTGLDAMVLNSNEEFCKILRNKTFHWAYENEWRLIYLNGTNCSVKIPIGMQMSEIILGPLSGDDQKNFFLSKCKEWDIDLSQVNASLNSELILHTLSKSHK